MSMAGDMRISYTEFIYMGQKDNLARYPLHWHNRYFTFRTEIAKQDLIYPALYTL